MSILSGYKKFKKYIKTSSGFQLQSLWSNANTVEADDGKNMETKVGAINGITSSTTANSTDIAASANLVNTRCNELSNKISSELGTGDGEMSLKSMVSELYGKLANFDLVVDISKYFSTNTAQVFEVKSSADLSGYEYIAICATFQKGKSGNFTEISGCEILDQLGWSHTTNSDEVAIHLVVLKNITGAISLLGRYGGTGSATVKAFGFK